jgi:hypothetical protein
LLEESRREQLAKSELVTTFLQNCDVSHVVLPKAAKRSAYSAALPILSSDAPYELLLFRQPLNAITELLKTCDTMRNKSFRVWISIFRFDFTILKLHFKSQFHNHEGWDINAQ